MGGRPEVRVAMVEMGGVVMEEVGDCCFSALLMLLLLVLFVLLLQQGELGGGISVVIVGMVVVMMGSSARSVEFIGFCWFSSCTVVSSVDGIELRTQQHGPSDLSHWHPVLLVVLSDESVVKASSQVM